MFEEITEFCTSFTEVSKSMCFRKNEHDQYMSPTLIEALAQLHQHLENLGIFKHEFTMMSFGDHPSIHLQRETNWKKLKLANYWKRWINI